VAKRGPASPCGEDGSRRFSEVETSPDTARDTRMQAAELAELRELNQRRARLIRNLSSVYSLEPLSAGASCGGSAGRHAFKGSHSGDLYYAGNLDKIIQKQWPSPMCSGGPLPAG
jgi:hypothetical protein